MELFITTTSVILAVHVFSDVNCVCHLRDARFYFFIFFWPNTEPVIRYFLTVLFVLLQGTIDIGVFFTELLQMNTLLNSRHL